MAYFAMKALPHEPEFVIEIKDAARAEHARKILRGDEQERVHVHGRIVKRTAPYNPRFSFHLDPDTIDFFDMAIEVCDSSALYLEEHLDEAGGAFLPGGHWCPWGSQLTREVEHASA